jgi:hypothetical protein
MTETSEALDARHNFSTLSACTGWDESSSRAQNTTRMIADNKTDATVFCSRVQASVDISFNPPGWRRFPSSETICIRSGICSKSKYRSFTFVVHGAQVSILEGIHIARYKQHRRHDGCHPVSVHHIIPVVPDSPKQEDEILRAYFRYYLQGVATASADHFAERKSLEAAPRLSEDCHVDPSQHAAHHIMIINFYLCTHVGNIMLIR